VLRPFWQSDFEQEAYRWSGKIYQENGYFLKARKYYNLAKNVRRSEYPNVGKVEFRNGFFTPKGQDYWNFQQMRFWFQPQQKWGVGCQSERWERYRKIDWRYGFLGSYQPWEWLSLSAETYFCLQPFDFLPKQYYTLQSYWDLPVQLPVSLLAGVSHSSFVDTHNFIYSTGIESYFYKNYYGGYRFFWVVDAENRQSSAHQWYGGWVLAARKKVAVSYSRGGEMVDAITTPDDFIHSWHGMVKTEWQVWRQLDGLLQLGYFEDENGKNRWEYELGCQIHF